MILTLVFTFAISRAIYYLAWIYKPINHPWGFKIYVAIRHTFGATSAEESEDLIMYFILGLALSIAIFIVWGIFRLVRYHSKP